MLENFLIKILGALWILIGFVITWLLINCCIQRFKEKSRLRKIINFDFATIDL